MGFEQIDTIRNYTPPAQATEQTRSHHFSRRSHSGKKIQMHAHLCSQLVYRFSLKNLLILLLLLSATNAALTAATVSFAIFSVPILPAETGSGTYGQYGSIGFKTTDAAVAHKMYFSIGGTATNGIDYVYKDNVTGAYKPLTSPWVFSQASGSVFDQILIYPINDLLAEPQETVILTILPDPSYIIGSSNVGGISIDDFAPPLPSISIAATDPSASEVGPDTGTFTVTRTGSTASAVTVPYSLAGTATSSDYTALSGSVQILAGNPSATITVTPVADSLVEGSETVIMNLTANAALYTIGSPSSATVTIADGPVVVLPTISIAATDPSASEVGPNTGTFTVTRTGATTSALLVSYGLGGSASSNDYAALSGSVQIPAGALSAPILVTPIADLQIEGSETVIASINANAALYAIGSQSSATVTIADGYAARVNFQPTAAPIVAGYAVDDGSLYGVRSNGMTYGWNVLHTDVTRDRGVNADQRLDTLCHMHANANWQIALPAGSYEVLVSIGDASNASVHTLNVEGVNAWTATSLAANVFANKTVTVPLADGKLTLNQGSAADKSTRINYIEVTAISLPSSDPILSFTPVGGGVFPPVNSSVAKVYSLALNGQELCVGGAFSRVGSSSGLFSQNLAKWNGTSWTKLPAGPDFLGNAPGALLTLNGFLYTSNVTVNGEANGRLRTINLSSGILGEWGTGPVGTSSGSGIQCMAALGSDIYVGGPFTMLPSNQPGTGTNYGIARLNGSGWTNIGTLSINGNVQCMTVLGGNLYVGGTIPSINGTTYGNIAKWNGSTWTAMGSGLDGRVTSMTVMGNDLIVSGLFTTAGGVSAQGYAKWNGSQWTAMGAPGPGGARAMAVLNGNLYIAGDSPGTWGDGNNMARWDGTAWHIIPVMGEINVMLSTGTEIFIGASWTASFTLTLPNPLTRMTITGTQTALSPPVGNG